MPFDAAAFSAEPTNLAAAFDAARPPEAEWALANPEKALAFLMVAPQPCAALDALLDA